MDVLADTLVASGVNGGGVFLVDDTGVEWLSKIDTTGIAAIPGGFLLARQAEGVAELRRLRDGSAERIRLMEASLDLHDLLWNDGRVFVVCTQTNSLVEFNAETFAELRNWRLPGEPDSQHVNSICLHEGRILATRFGRFSAHRGYKGRTRGAGEVFDVETGEVVIGGLSQPHSLTSHEGRLWLCDSEAHVVRVYRNFNAEAEYAFEGYVRGLAFGDTHLYVGLSRSRNVEASAPASAAIVVVDRSDMRAVGQVGLPVNEVYDLRLLGKVDRTGLLRAALADAVAEFDTLVHARNVAGERGRETAMRAGRAAIDHERGLAAQMARAAAQKATEAEEEAAWSRMLAAERARLEGVIAGHERVVASQQRALQAAGASLEDAAASLKAFRQQYAALQDGMCRDRRALSAVILAQQGFIEAVTTSRSWRWTRLLRRMELEVPQVPADLAIATEPHVDMAGPAAAADAPVVDDASAAHRVQASLQALRDGGDHGFVAADPAAGPRRSMVPILGLEFAEHAEPVVSIFVMAYGNFAQTLACLRSIRDAGDQTSFEVILIEDASGDDEMGRFALVPGLRYHANPLNLGFLRSANQAGGLARGAFVHLLNNDTRVRGGWLDALMRTFARFHECGMAGSMLVYPDGRLQEAGGIVWNDGDAMNHGRGDDPARPRYSVVREVDYVSGASLLMRTALFRHLGGFDERYLPAYYEDTDLAFRVREAGFRVYVEPASVVEHHEGLSHGTDIERGIKSSQAVNRQVFRERWHDVLGREQLPPGEHLFLARDRAQLRKVVLVVDRYPPEPDRDAGSRAIWQLMRVMFLQGYCVKFWADRPRADQGYVANLLAHGIESFCDEVDGVFEHWIADHGAYLDSVVLSRPMIAGKYIDAVRRHSRASVVFYGHDIHAQRIGRHAVLDGDARLAEEAEHVKSIEQDVWLRSDLVLYPSAEETAHVREWLGPRAPGVQVETVPLFAFEAVPTLDPDAPAGVHARSEVLFVGGFSHVPNADGAKWFVREVWPLVRARCPGLRLCLVGGDPPADLVAFAADDVDVTGYLSETDLLARYGLARVAIAPLRFGAGTKGKVLEAMLHGVPCVVTPSGAQGLADASFLRVREDAVSMADAIVALVEDDAAWWQASGDGQEYVRRCFSVQAVWNALSITMDPHPYRDVQARRDAMTRRAP